jgi:hypothetical protein
MAEQALTQHTTVVGIAALGLPPEQAGRHIAIIEQLSRAALSGTEPESAAGRQARHSVALLKRMLELSDLPTCTEAVIRLGRVIEDDIQARSSASLRTAALSEARQSTPRTDPVTTLLAKGSIGQAELHAARSIRCVLAQMEGWSGVGAVDPTQLRVDGGRGWSEMLHKGTGTHPATETVRAWAARIESGFEMVQGKRATMTPLDVCLRVVVQCQSISSLVEEMGIRKETLGPMVADMLRLYRHIQ